MTVIFSLISPIFLIILVGYFSGKKKLFNQDGLNSLNHFAFFIAIPALIFISMAKANWHGDDVFWLVVALTICIFLIIGIVFLIGKIFFAKSTNKLAIDANIASFPNAAYAGLPIISLLFPASYLPPAIIATIVFNIISINAIILILEFNKKNDQSSLKQEFLRIGFSILTNPVTYPTILGIIFSYYGLGLPNSIAKFCELLANTAAPIGLFIVGLSIALYGINISNIRQIILPIFLKLFALPAIVALFVLQIMPLSLAYAHSAIIISAMPTGVLAFVIAQKYKTNAKNAASAIFISTILSSLTLISLIYLLKPI